MALWIIVALWPPQGPIILIPVIPVIPVVPRKHYCPVTLSLQNELVCCYDRSMAVEYNSKAAVGRLALAVAKSADDVGR